MDVEVIETKTSRVLAIYPIHITGMNYKPTEQEFLDGAWQCAVEDKLVDAARRDQYVLRAKREQL